MAAGKIAEVAFSKFIDKLLERSWVNNQYEVKDILIQLSEPTIANRFVEKYVSRHMTMRTLVVPNHDIVLDDIYVPIHLRVHTSPKNFIDYIVDDDFTFSFKSVVNIVGIAGQGKSTVLRKLFVNSFNKSNKFPFFIELRKLRQLTIFDYLRQHLEDIGVRVTSEVIDGFLSSGRVVIYLDGFDELKSEDRQEIINQIKSLNTKYDICIVVTSRPHTEICNEPFIENFELLTLKKNEVCQIINKLSQYKTEASKCSHVTNNNISIPSKVIDILETPILVNLYYICSLNKNEEFTRVSDFYDRVFPTLFRTHDIQKGYRRDRTSIFNFETVVDVFDSICFHSVSNEQFDFTFQQLILLVIDIFRSKGLDEQEAEAVLSDIINITSLIQHDGFDNYVFLHKSIPEFHCAKYIEKLKLPEKQKEYSILIHSVDLNSRYDNILSYLSEIDLNSFSYEFITKYFNKYRFDTQDIHTTFTELAKEIISQGTVSAYIGNHRHITISWDRDPSNETLCKIVRLLKGQRTNPQISTTMSLRNYHIPHQRLAQIAACDTDFVDVYAPTVYVRLDQEYTIKLNIYLRECGIYDQVIAEVIEYLHDVYKTIYLRASNKDKPVISTIDI